MTDAKTLAERLRSDGTELSYTERKRYADLIEQQAAEIERLRKHPITDATYLGLAEDIARLTAERDALRADALRYRWLRDSSNPGADLLADWDMDGADDDELDAAIDAARKDATS